MGERDRYILLSIINELKEFLPSLGWAIVNTPSPLFTEVYLTEGYQETKVSGNCVGVAYSEISDPIPVELGNSRLRKINRNIAISVVSPLEEVASTLASNIKRYFDSKQVIEILDESGESIGQIQVDYTVAQRYFGMTKEEWQKNWWVVQVTTTDYLEL